MNYNWCFMDGIGNSFSFHLMAKPIGAICNLNCKYCFYKSKKELYPNNPTVMSDEVLEEYTKQYIGAINIPEVTFAWQGGEPTLMGIEFFKNAIKFQEMYKKPGMKIYNTIQTNGILLDTDWCEFFQGNHFLVGISIDGPQDLHDAYRKDKKGNPSFDQVMCSLKLLKKHKVEFNILSTVNRINADYPLEIYNFFKDEVGAKHIQFIPIVELENKDSVSDESVLPEQYGKFLSTIFDKWVKNDVGRVYVQIFDATLASWVNYPPSVCVFAPTCGTALIIEHNGDIYACDHFVDPKHLLGNIMENSLEEMVVSSEQLSFGQDKIDNLPQQCIQCSLNFACHGACPKHRFCNDTYGEPKLNYLCSSYKEFFEHIKLPMEIMASLFNQGRAPAEIMSILNGDQETLRNIFPNLGRNDLCPCGSGLKFKKCHGKI
jgi:uncharacterized protein